MKENQDDLNIDINLNILCESDNPYEFSLNNFVDKNGRQKHLKYKNEEFASLMEQQGLIRVNGFKCSVEKFGLEVYNNGGWLKYLSDIKEKQIELELKQKEKEQLEIKLSKSNIEANKLNKKIAKTNEKNEKNNKITTWINIIIGIINISLLLWQILRT